MKELDELITYIENDLIGKHKDIEIIDEAIKKYAELYHAEQLRIGGVSIDWKFIEWLDRGMWSNHENGADGIVRQELWYNTYNFSAMKKPLTKEQLYDKYKATLDEC